MGFKPRGPITTTVVGTTYWAIMLGIIALAILLMKFFCPRIVSSVCTKFCCSCRRSMNITWRPPETSESSSPIIRRRNLRQRNSLAVHYRPQEIEAAAARPIIPRILSSSSEESSPLPRLRAATFGGVSFREVFSQA
jgi:hypothetical protein